MKAKLTDDTDLGIDGLKWDVEHPNDSLEKLYQSTIEFAQRKVRYYYDDAERNRRLSTGLRLSGFAVLTLGALFPLVEATDSKIIVGQWGYVVLALGGALVYADQLVGASASWVRSTVTWLSLRKALTDFQYQWLEQLSKSQSASQKPIPKLLIMLRKFRAEIESQISQETDVWRDELQRAIQELRKRS